VHAEYTTNQSSDNFHSSREQFDRIVAFLESAEAFRASHVELEDHLVREGRELQRRLLQEHLHLRSMAERRLPRVVGADGVERKEARPLEVGLGSMFGNVQDIRLVYQAAGVGGLAPMDACLNLPTGYYSHGIRRLVAEHAAKESFDEVVAEVKAITGCDIHKRQVEELAVAASVDFEDYYAQSPIDRSLISLSARIILSFDGKGIVMRTEDLREATRKAAIRSSRKLRKRLTKGEKRNRKRIAEVATVYAVEPYIRDPEDVVRELRPVRDVSTRRPRPSLKRVWASVVEDSIDVIDEAFTHARRLDPKLEHPWVVLVDGNRDQIRAIRKVAMRHGVRIVLIVDLMHVLEYHWKAAYCFYPEGSQGAEDWVTERLRLLLTGHDPSQIAAGMRRSASRRELTASERKPVDACARYLINNRRCLDYQEALRCGYPISTGVVEGACRYLVKDRMDRTGARWSINGAEAVLRLRALRASGDFSDYWTFHMACEQRRNYTRSYPDGNPPSPFPPVRSIRPNLRRIK
jgi:hypothetical protein